VTARTNTTYVQTNLCRISGWPAHRSKSPQSWGTSSPGQPDLGPTTRPAVTTLYDGGNPTSSGERPTRRCHSGAALGRTRHVGAPRPASTPSTRSRLRHLEGAPPYQLFVFATENGSSPAEPAVDLTHAVIASTGRPQRTMPTSALSTRLDVGDQPRASSLREHFRSGGGRVRTPSIWSTALRIHGPAGFAPFGIHNIGARVRRREARRAQAR